MTPRITGSSAISIHAPRVGSDHCPASDESKRKQFQSTLPVWGATAFFGAGVAERGAFQSTLPVWGATIGCAIFAVERGISIHAPRVGSDELREGLQKDHHYFNPRSPCGERLPTDSQGIYNFIFQSTLPVWGATLIVPAVPIGIMYFNPRSPCGERPLGIGTRSIPTQFQSTLPVWGATSAGVVYLLRSFAFQSTLPVWGATTSSSPLQI